MCIFDKNLKIWQTPYGNSNKYLSDLLWLLFLLKQTMTHRMAIIIPRSGRVIPVAIIPVKRDPCLPEKWVQSENS